MTTRQTAFPHDCPHPDCDERFSERGLVTEHVELFHDDVEEPTPAR